MSENIKTVEIKIDGVLGQVIVDGVNVKNIREYRLVHKAGEVPRLELDIISPYSTVKGEMKVDKIWR